MSKSTTITTKTVDYSIPGKFLVIIQPSTAPPPPPPPIIGHCLLCLRRLREPTGLQNLKIGQTLDDLTIVPKAVLSETHLLPTFNKLLPFIHKKWKPEKKTDPLNLLNKNVPGYQAPDSGAPSNLPKNFPHLPAMCSMCGEQLEQLNGLIKLLGGKIDEIRGIIKMSKMPEGIFGWRQLQFEDDLRNNEDLNEVSRRRTIEFLEGFGEVEEEDEEEMEVMVEATGDGGGDEEDPLAFDEGEEFEVKVEREEEDSVEHSEHDGVNDEEEWSPPEIKEEPESGPESSNQSRKRGAPGPASKTVKLAKTTEIISDSFEMRREEEDGPRRSSRITIDKGRSLSLSLSSSRSAVKGKGKDQFNG